MSSRILISIKLNRGIFKVGSCPNTNSGFLSMHPLHQFKFHPSSFVWTEKCKIGTEEQNEWYFFSHKDKKYPTGTRTNRATTAGFWKATGRDKAIYSKHNLIGMRKTLVFYKGRAPNGQKSDWIMHEYRLETNENGTPQASFFFFWAILMSNSILNSLKIIVEISSLCLQAAKQTRLLVHVPFH